MNSTIVDAFVIARAYNPKHFYSLFNRETGSQFDFPFRSPNELAITQVAELPWKELPRDEHVDGIHLPFCVYFFVEERDMPKAFPHAHQRMEPSDRVKPEDITVAQGQHGPELQSSSIDERACTTAWLIVGPAEDDEGKSVEGHRMVWTMYPGELTPPTPKDWDGELKSLDLSQGYAVKAA